MRRNRGFLYIMAIFAVLCLSIGLLTAIQPLATQMEREREEELIFRGDQYRLALDLYSRKKPGAAPKDFKELVQERCLRRLYKEPFSEDGVWDIVTYDPVQKEGKKSYLVFSYDKWLTVKDRYPMVGVASPVKRKSFRIYKGREKSHEWLFALGIGEKIPDFKRE